jgi:hypothetical protein
MNMENTIDESNRQSSTAYSDESQEILLQTASLNKSCILVVTSHSQPAEPVMDYVINVADRLGSKILVVSVNTRPLLQDTLRVSDSTLTAPDHNTDLFRMKAASRGVVFECLKESGKISRVINRLCRVVKRVEFVVVDQGIKMEEANAGSPVPVFSVVCNESRTGQGSVIRQIHTSFHGEKRMKATSRKTYFAKTLVFGAMTAALYGAVFTYSESIMHYWTKGGIYALLPVATVFVFSYAHGSFTGNFWSALGIEGSKASAQKQAGKQVNTTDQASKRPDTRPRAQVNA